MANKQDLWGDFSGLETIRTPYIILKEQADILTKKTNGLLMGEVNFSQVKQIESLGLNFGEPGQLNKNQLFVAFLRIKAPSLNNYTYSVVKVQYPITEQGYPVLVNSLVDENWQRHCASEEEFQNALREILSSEQVKKVISALLSQIHADIPKS